MRPTGCVAMTCWPSLNVCQAAHQVPSSLTRSLGGAGELVERDAERGGQALGDVERRLLLAALVAVDLAEVDAGGARESRLREAGLLAEASEDLAEVGVLFAGFHGSRHGTDESVIGKKTN